MLCRSLTALVALAFMFGPAAADAIADLAAARAAYLAAWNAAPLHVSSASFVDREAQHLGDVDERSRAVFDAGEPIRVYIEVQGYDFRKVRGGVEFGVILDLDLKNAEGRTIFQQKAVQDLKLRAETEVFGLFLNYTMRLSGIGGYHTALLTLRDPVSGQATELPMAFEIR